MKISLIVAADEKNGIGNNNSLPWHLPSEMKYFMETTLNHIVIMGRKSFEALGKPLKNRLNVVISSNFQCEFENVVVVCSLEEALKKSSEWLVEFPNLTQDEIFITGGGQIYQLALENNWIDYLYFTRINGEFDCDTFFPIINWKDWDLMKETLYPANEKNQYNYTIQLWKNNIKSNI